MFRFLIGLIGRPVPTSRPFCRLSLEYLEDRCVMAQLTWVGPLAQAGNWSDIRNWVGGPNVPGYGDDAFLGGPGGSNGDVKLDVGGGVLWQIEKLRVVGYTGTLTLPGNTVLVVDQLDMNAAGATITGGTLRIMQRTANLVGAQRSLLFFASGFFNGTVASNVDVLSEQAHPATLDLSGPNNTSAFKGNLTIDAFTTVSWRGGNVAFAAGKTFTINDGTFIANSDAPTRTFGNATGKWTLQNNKGQVVLGNGSLLKGDVKSNGGQTFQRVPPPGGDIVPPPDTSVFTIDGDMTMTVSDDGTTGSLLEADDGTLVITGNVTSDTGSMVEDQSVLVINGNLNAGNVDSFYATLRIDGVATTYDARFVGGSEAVGNGWHVTHSLIVENFDTTLTGDLYNDGGTVGVGWVTLSVTGNYTQSAAGHLAVFVDDPETTALAVGGTANLNGILDATFTNAPSAGFFPNLLTAGTFAGSLSVVAPPGYAGSLTNGDLTIWAV